MAILSQAARLFNYKGSRATTLRDIADHLGLTKTSLYYYVRTKEALIYQCYMAALDRQHHNLDEIEAKHCAPIERFSAFFLRHFEDWFDAHSGRGPHLAALLEIASLRDSHRSEVETRYIDLFKRLRQYIREGVDGRSMRRCDTGAVTRAVLGSLDWAFSWLHGVPLEDVIHTAERALDIVLRGVYGGIGEYRPAALKLEGCESAALQGFNRLEQNRLKQEAFFRTGTRFFNRQGFNGTSLEEIAEQLHVSKGAFYYHIRNKEDLLYSCYSRSLDIVERIHKQVAATNGCGLQKVDLTCRRIFHVQNSNEGPLIRYTSITALPMDRRREIVSRTDSSNEHFGNFISEGMCDGSVRPVSTFVAQNLIAGAVNASMDIHLWHKVNDLDAAAIDYFDIFFNGLLPRP
jgi:AcrR family transcriptional regulator